MTKYTEDQIKLKNYIVKGNVNTQCKTVTDLNHWADYGQPMNVWCQEFSRKIIKEANSLNRSMLTASEINHIIYLVEMFKDIDGYYHDISDQRLERLEKKLSSMKAEARATKYELKQE